MSNKKKNDETQKQDAAVKKDTAKKPKEKPAEERLKEELGQKTEQYLRLAAEYDNFRKRSVREKECAYTDAKMDTVKELLPVVDNLERALAGDESDAANYKKGVEMTLEQLEKTLVKLGIEAFGESGEDFDPTLHNAVMHVEDEAFEEQKIAEVFQKGYRLGDKVIREAVVKVAN